MEILGGTGCGAGLRRAWLATRPQFLTASVLPVLLGTAWGARGGGLDLVALVLAALGVALMHAASNVFNDVGDAIGGSDAANHARIYPYTGGSRFIQNGIMTIDGMRGLAKLLGLSAMLVGLLLLIQYGWPVAALGLTGLALGVAYSLPAIQLSGRGLGELAVALAFGPLPVSGAAWLQQGHFDAITLWLALPVAAWVMAILLINEVPDRRADGATGKRTLPVRLGLRATAVVYGGLQLTAMGGILIWQQQAGLPGWVLVIPAGLLVTGVLQMRRIDDSAANLRAGIQATLGIHALGCLWLIVASLLTR